MFAPDHARAASELLRVTRPGGQVGLATWTPDGFIGELLKVVAGHVPPPAGVASPILWGTEEHRASSSSRWSKPRPGPRAGVPPLRPDADPDAESHAGPDAAAGRRRP